MAVDVLAAGRDLDRLVAERVKGWRWANIDGTASLLHPDTWSTAGYSDGPYVPLPSYSTDPLAALRLLDGWPDHDIRCRSGQYTVDLYRPSQEWRGRGETLALAICRAVLAAS